VAEQCEVLSRVFGCHNLAVGKLVRSQVMGRTILSTEISQAMSEGKPIMPSTYASLYRAATEEVHVPLARAGTPEAHLLVNGYPRSAEQLEALISKVGRPVMAVLLHAPVAEALARARLLSASTDADGFSRQHAQFEEKVAPMLDVLERMAVPVHKLDVSSRDDTAVFDALCTRLGWRVPDGAKIDFVAVREERC